MLLNNTTPVPDDPAGIAIAQGMGNFLIPRSAG
jgi:hypothetical protein